MIASNVSLQTLVDAAADIGVEIEASALSASGRRFRVKVSPKVGAEQRTESGRRKRGENGDSAYQRVSWDGAERRVHAVCWHGFRDFFRAVFSVEPEARFYTAYDKWLGSEDFEARFRFSGHKNIGSMFSPMLAADACRCPDRGYAG
jgi:hypothetical protein